MKKTALLLMAVCLLVGVPGVFADSNWTNVNSSRLWRDSSNWDAGVPTAADKAGVRNGSAFGPLIDSITTAIANTVVVGDWSNTDSLDITGGSLTTNSWFILGYGSTTDGTFNVSGGTTVVNGHLTVGRAGTGRMEVTHGTVTVNNEFRIASTGGTGHVQLDGGSITCESISMAARATMDITSGTLIIDGYQTAAVIELVNTGKITAYGDTGTVLYDTTTNPGKTTVSATPELIRITVPDLTDIPQGTAESDIVAAGLVIGTVSTQLSDAFDPGDVISQSPAGGSLVMPASSVNIVVRPEAGNGDVDSDGNVNETDLTLTVAEWLGLDPDPDTDFTRDGNVDMDDYQILAAHWGDNNDYSQTLTGKIMCGYQGWFNAPGDGADLGWVHWGGGNKFEPGYCTIDWWPDMSEYGADEKFPSGFQYADGSTAYVFSSYNRKTVLRHFSWMADYGIDGIFLQRFIGGTSPGPKRDHKDQVMLNCRQGANKYKRAWAMMYDLSSSYTTSEIKDQVISDWKHLVDTYQVTQDPTDSAYLHHNGKPVVAVWGLGFDMDGGVPRQYDGQGTVDIIDFLKNDPVYGGCTIMIGVDNQWRQRMLDPSWAYLDEIVQMADIISPWAVGRYGSVDNEGNIDTASLDNFTNNYTIPDQAWCNANGKDYLPGAFPGFSWYNLKHDDEGYTAVFDSRPRLGGAFLWRQFYKAINDAGVTMIYQAMFDEVDEGTAIFKISNSPPISEEPSYSNPFLPTGNAQHAPYDSSDASLPSDHYLWLVGEGTKMLRGEIPISETMPSRP